MPHKTILINLPESEMPLQTIENALHIFNIKRIHLDKETAFVEFRRPKDYQAFQFTNAHGTIPSLKKATYQLVNPDFKWNFPIEETHVIKAPEGQEREQTEPESQGDKSSQQNVQQTGEERSQTIEKVLIENPKPLQTPEDLHEALRIERMQQEEWRNSVNLDTSSQMSEEKVLLQAPKDENIYMKNFNNMAKELKRIAIENGTCLSNKLNEHVKLPEKEKVTQVMREYGLTFLLAIVAIIVFLI